MRLVERKRKGPFDFRGRSLGGMLVSVRCGTGLQVQCISIGSGTGSGSV